MLSIGKKSTNKRGGNKNLITIEEIVKALDFDIITTMVTIGNEGVNNTEHINNCIS